MSRAVKTPRQRGWEEVAKNIGFAPTQFKEGRIRFETLAKYVGQDLAYLVEIEDYEAKLFGSENMAHSVIRVTNVFRREDGVWRLVHRHGDPIPATLAVIQAVPKTIVSVQESV